MAFGLIVNTKSAAGVNTGITPSVNTTGVNLLVVHCTYYDVPGIPTLTDSKSNTWTRLTRAKGANNVVDTVIFYCINPTVGSGHTFTTTLTGGYSTIGVSGWSAVGAITYEKQNTNGVLTNSTSIQTGSVTPNEANTLIVAAFNGWTASGSFAIDAGFTILNYYAYQASLQFGGGDAYLLQGAAAAVNPKWSWTGATTDGSATIAVFKEAVTATGLLLFFNL